MHKKYRFNLNDLGDMIVNYDSDGTTGSMTIWQGDKLYRSIGIFHDLPETDEDFERILRDEMDEPCLELERWVDLTVHLDVTETVTISLSAFEYDDDYYDMRDLMDKLLRTSFKDEVLALFLERVAANDPDIEVGWVEEGRGVNYYNDEVIANYMKETE